MNEILFQIVNNQTGAIVGKPYKNKNRARTQRDKLDNEYGGYRYSVKEVTAK